MKYFKKIIFLCIFSISLSIFINEKVHANEINNDPLNVDMPNGSIGDIGNDNGGGGGTSDENNYFNSAVTIPTHFDFKESYSRSDIIDYKDDFDYFKFSSNVSGYMNFHFSSSNNKYSIVARIYNENKEELISNHDTTPCESCSFDINNFRIEKNKLYYIQINNGDYNTPYNTYNFSMTLVDDLNNENHPEPINSNVNISSSIDYVGDVDYYTFTANESGVWGYKVTGILNADISIICNDKDIKYSNSLYTYYGSANYQLTNSAFFAFKEGGHYTIKIKGSTIGTYSITKDYDIGMQTIELNSKSFSNSVVYSYPGYIDGYQGYKIGYFTTKDKAKLFINSLSSSNQTEIYAIGFFTFIAGIKYPVLGPAGFLIDTYNYVDNETIEIAINYANQQIDEVDSEGIYIALRLKNGSVSNYQMTIGPWDQKTYYYSDIYYYDYGTIIDEY
ncbi:hypothetical protein KHQ81_14965 [Mycoplasmatota bacterium]|nr:hypothetical protein KHQ81_14965 [Mycoplasmatota bacterium]